MSPERRSRPPAQEDRPATNSPAVTIPRQACCGCARQGDWWLCQDRPTLEATEDDRVCELGWQWRTTGTDWDQALAGGRRGH